MYILGDRSNWHNDFFSYLFRPVTDLSKVLGMPGEVEVLD